MNEKEWQPIQELFLGTWIAMAMIIAELAGAGALDLRRMEQIFCEASEDCADRRGIPLGGIAKLLKMAADDAVANDLG